MKNLYECPHCKKIILPRCCLRCGETIVLKEEDEKTIFCSECMDLAKEANKKFDETIKEIDEIGEEEYYKKYTEDLE